MYVDGVIELEYDNKCYTTCLPGTSYVNLGWKTCVGDPTHHRPNIELSQQQLDHYSYSFNPNLAGHISNSYGVSYNYITSYIHQLPMRVSKYIAFESATTTSLAIYINLPMRVSKLSKYIAFESATTDQHMLYT